MDPRTPVNQSPMPAQQPGSRVVKKKLLFVLVGVLLVLGGLIGWYVFRAQQENERLTANPAQVIIQADGFNPATIKVKAGQAVAWTNQDTATHAIVTDDQNSELDGTEALEEGDVFSYSFDKPGTYTYHDSSNNTAFKGTIIVE